MHTRSTDGSVIHTNDDIEGREGTDSDEAIDRRRAHLSENRKRSKRKFLELEGRTWKERGRSLAARTRKTYQALNIRLKLEAEEMAMRTDTSEYKTKIAVCIGRFLTQKVIRPQKLDSLLRQEVHGANFATLRGNEVSNRILMSPREEDRCPL
jgi:hypothetical protein